MPFKFHIKSYKSLCYWLLAITIFVGKTSYYLLKKTSADRCQAAISEDLPDGDEKIGGLGLRWMNTFFFFKNPLVN
jgi:hypothetical protein